MIRALKWSCIITCLVYLYENLLAQNKICGLLNYHKQGSVGACSSFLTLPPHLVTYKRKVTLILVLLTLTNKIDKCNHTCSFILCL